jgi:replication factor C subunit 1
MDIVCTGKGVVVPPGARIHSVLREGYTLYVGTACYDGRPITESLRYREAVQRGIPIVFCVDALADSMDCLSVAGKEELWVDRYAPKTVKEIIGHSTVVAQVAQWLSLAVRPAGEKGLLLTGPPGIGKSTLIRIVAKELGYHIAESNASDARTASVLRGQIALGMRRLRKEVIVMEEADGCDRGGAAELAQLITKSPTPIICVANDARAVASLAKVCLHVKVARPSKSVIAAAMEVIAKKERVSVTRQQLEKMVEESGNDIRSVLNQLQMRGSGVAIAAEKDSMQRMDPFSATGRLLAQKGLPWTDAEDLVYVDHHMVPLMVQECYLTASRSLEEAVAASEMISDGNIMQRRLLTSQEWALLPSIVATTIGASRTVSGSAPFNIFPKSLGKGSSRRAQEARLQEIGRTRKISGASFRLEEADSMYSILARPLLVEPPLIADTVARLDAIGLTRDDLMESIEGVVTPLGISTKTRSAFTRLYNKKNPSDRAVKGKAVEAMDVDGESDAEEEEEM